MRIILFLLLSLVSAKAQNAYTEASYNYIPCLEQKEKINLSIQECLNDEWLAWDTKLNANYQALLKTASSFQKQKLVESQRVWISYSKSACSVYTDDKRGKLENIRASVCNYRETKIRAETLSLMLERLK